MRSVYLLCGLLGTLLLQGQNNRIDFGWGVGVPFGAFSAVDLEAEGSGKAKPGRSLHFSYSRMIKEDLWLGVSVFEFVNKVDDQKMLDAFYQEHSGLSAAIIGRNWNNIALMIGIAKEIQFTNSNFSIEPNVRLGLLRSFRSGILITDGNNGDSLNLAGEEETNSNALAIMLGFSPSYTFSSKAMLSLEVDYFYSAPEITVTSEEMTYSTPLVREVTNYTQAIHILSLRLGVKFFF